MQVKRSPRENYVFEKGKLIINLITRFRIIQKIAFAPLVGQIRNSPVIPSHDGVVHFVLALKILMVKIRARCQAGQIGCNGPTDERILLRTPA